MVTISLPLLVVAFVLQCASAAIRREPARLGHALLGALLGTAGVPFSVGIIAACGQMVDQMSAAILGNEVTQAGFKRMLNVTALMSVGTLGGFLAIAIALGILATAALYFVMLIREVALVAFVVFAPIALASWTWSATRHWLRRWIEVVGALLFSKIAMAVVFTLGLSATGAADQHADASIGTFLTGILLFAMAAFAPMATYSFIHWAGDQGHTAVHALQQGTAGASAVKERVEQAQQWGAHHFGGSSGKDDAGPVVGDGNNSADTSASSDSATAQGPRLDGSVGAPSGSQPASGGEGASAVAVATSQVSVDGSAGPGQQSDSRGDSDSKGSE
ncbi:type IV secretion system protein [Kribbella sp. CA-245084]|uniref:type IV secretion system protein n=1 Tax=Kribbella sp. CA-245084 TaxID=3239940 RepID=UPI003D947DF8